MRWSFCDHCGFAGIMRLSKCGPDDVERMISAGRLLTEHLGIRFTKVSAADRCVDGLLSKTPSLNLQSILQEGLQTAQQQLTHAKALLTRVEQGLANTTAERQTGGLGTRWVLPE